MIWFNYALIAQFSVLTLGHAISGNWATSLYWLGSVVITVAVTVR